MRRNIILTTLIAIIAISICAFFVSPSALLALCGSYVGVSNNDTTCGTLDTKLEVWDERYSSMPGVFPAVVYDQNSFYENGNERYMTGFKPGAVGDGAIWNNGDEDFMWTFDTTSQYKDPSMSFSPYKTTHTGEFEVYTEYDDFNNDYTTVPCTLKYDGSLQSSSFLTGTVTFTLNETYVTADENLESQMTPGCYMISANGTKWYYIDHFDEVYNTKLYLLTKFAEATVVTEEARKRQYSCDMDTFKGSFEKAGTDNVKIASGFRAKEPSVSSGQILNYSGLYIDPIKTTSTQNYIYKPFGIFQSGEDDLNAFRGHTGMGMWDGVDNAVLQIAQTYNTDDSNYGIGITVEQEGPVRTPNYPSGLTCNLNYSAAAVTPETIEKVSGSGGGDDTFTFTEGSGSVTADYPMDNPPDKYDWVKPSAGTHWYVVASENNTTSFVIQPDFEEETMTHVTAEKMPAAYRMSGISGSNMLTGTGATSSIRGVTGHVGLTGTGNVQAGIGTRGGMSMTGGGWMGLGACLGTYTDISAGALGVWCGLGIESPVFNGSAKVKKEIMGVGIDSLLKGADEGTVESTCMVYGVKIKTIDPDNIFPGVVKYGIYQEGDEDNYLGGALEVEGATRLKSTLTVDDVVDIKEYVNIGNTSSLRVHLSDDNTPSSSYWQKVNFDSASYDQREEFDLITDHQFEADLSGIYQINVCLFFERTKCNEKIEVKLVKVVPLNPVDLTYYCGWGYCNPRDDDDEDTVSLSFSEQLKLTAGDVIELAYRAPADIYVAEGQYNSFMTIQKIS